MPIKDLPSGETDSADITKVGDINVISGSFSEQLQMFAVVWLTPVLPCAGPCRDGKSRACSGMQQAQRVSVMLLALRAARC
jgi:hypothetical protein